jgi:hypothetical protein
LKKIGFQSFLSFGNSEMTAADYFRVSAGCTGTGVARMVAEANSSEPSALYLSGCGHPSTLAKPTMCINHICGNITIHTCKTQNVHKTHLRQYHNTHMSGACLLDSQTAAVHLPKKLFEGDMKGRKTSFSISSSA